MDPNQTVQLHLLGARRAPMNQDEFDTKFNYMKGSRNRRISLDSYQVDCCVCCRLNVKSPQRFPNDAEIVFSSPKTLFHRFLPILEWLPVYDYKKSLLGDICAGISLALHSVAQGFAFAFLAGLPPICGLYTAFFASLIYTFFGTSKFSFFGSNVIICFFVRNIIERHSVPYDYIYLLSSNSTQNFDITGVEQIGIASTLTFLAGAIQAGLFTLRLDFVFSYVSQQVLSGFSFGLAIRIVFNQLQHVLHLKGNSCISELALTLSTISAKITPPSYKQCAFFVAKNKFMNKTGNYGFPFYFTQENNPVLFEDENCLQSVWDCFQYVNLYTMGLSLCVILFLIFAKQILGPLLELRVHSPVPFEFLLIVVICLLSELIDIKNEYQVETIGDISKGFPITVPQLSAFDDLALDGLALTLLIFAIHNRLALLIGKEQKYNVEMQTEQITLSSIGIISSFFGAHPPGGSLNRNTMALHAGAKSMLPNFGVVIILLPFIFGLGTLFSSLPLCVLSCLVLSSLWEYCVGLSKFLLLWKISKLDVFTWIFSCFTTIIMYNSTHALFFSIIFGLCTIVVRTQWPKFQLLVNVTGSGAYYAERTYYGSELLDDSGVAVMRFEAPLLFNNCLQFKRDVFSVAENIKGQILGVGIGTRTGSMKSANAASLAGIKDIPMRSTLLISGDIVPNYDTIQADTTVTKVLIIDFSSITITDASGLETMIEIHSGLADRKVKLLFASVNSTIRNRFKEFGGFDNVSKSNFFPSVHDAVLYSQQLGGTVAPSFHMSVSMNGCRDLITLSTATSHHDLEQNNRDEMSLGASPRPSLPEARISPPPLSPNKLKATTSNGN